MSYPTGELRAAVTAAVRDGHRLFDVDPDIGYHDAVRYLERFGYLPRDLGRVEYLLRVTQEAAQESLEQRELARGCVRRGAARGRSTRRRRFIQA